MENPQSWNLLTSSLAVSTLEDIERTWSFLVLQGLVRTDAASRQVVAHSIGEVLEEGENTGPSMAFRVAAKLQKAGITAGRATQSDPWAKLAKGRLAVVEAWSGSSSEECHPTRGPDRR